MFNYLFLLFYTSSLCSVSVNWTIILVDQRTRFFLIRFGLANAINGYLGFKIRVVCVENF